MRDSKARASENSSAAGRSKERYRRIALSGLSAGAVRIISLGATFVAVPIVSNHLGRERFGLWLTITSLVALLTFADLGISGGLVNALSECNGRSDRVGAASYVSSAFYTLSAIGLALGALFAASYGQVPWERLFRLESAQALTEVGPSLAIFAGCFLIAMPLGIAQRVHIGYQEGFLASLWLGLGSLIGLGCTILAVNMGASLPWLVLTTAGGPVIAGVLNSMVLYWKQRPWLKPSILKVSRPASKQLISTGFLFFTLGIAASVGYHSDNVVIARILGPASVPSLALPMKLFVIVPTVVSIALGPLWPAYGESIARGDIDWVSRAMKRSVMAGLALSIPLAIVLSFFTPQLMTLWVGESSEISIPLLLALGAWAVLGGVLGPFATFFNGANVIAFQVRWALTMAAFNLGLSIVLVQAIGVTGAMCGTLIAQVLFLLLPYSLKLRSLFALLRARESHNFQHNEFMLTSGRVFGGYGTDL